MKYYFAFAKILLVRGNQSIDRIIAPARMECKCLLSKNKEIYIMLKQ
jgi:hypothetical protein